MAQRNGFITAYAQVFADRFPDLEAGKAHAATLMKGCEHHFDASCTRVARSGSIIHLLDKDKFKFLAREMLRRDISYARYYYYRISYFAQ
jgi:hypothetical protein